MNKISILSIRFLSGKKSTQAFVDVRIGDIVIRDFRIYQTNGKPTVRNPFISYKNYDGKLIFRQIVDLPSNIQVEVNALALAEFFRRLKEIQNEQQSV